MKIIGIDPGLVNLGVAILEKKNEEIKLLFTYEIKTKSKENLEYRLYYIYSELKKIIEEYEPTYMAVEESFVNINNKSSLKLGMVIGIVLMLGAEKKIPIKIITPTAMKKNLTGYGHSSKDQIYFFLSNFLTIPNNLSHHIYDAIAIGFLLL